MPPIIFVVNLFTLILPCLAWISSVDAVSFTICKFRTLTEFAQLVAVKIAKHSSALVTRELWQFVIFTTRRAKLDWWELSGLITNELWPARESERERKKWASSWSFWHINQVVSPTMCVETNMSRIWEREEGIRGDGERGGRTDYFSRDLNSRAIGVRRSQSYCVNRADTK